VILLDLKKILQRGELQGFGEAAEFAEAVPSSRMGRDF
jgi:hypothetical protein